MNFLRIFVISLLLINCSFDKKSGVWKNESDQAKNENIIFKDFKTISSTYNLFDKNIPIDEKFRFKLKNSLNNSEWKDIYLNDSNNYENLKYNNQNQIVFKSSKLTKHDVNKSILFEENNLIFSDKKGNIIVFSIKKDEIISKFNFYKKRFKKIDKILNLKVSNNIIYVSDSIGYLYAFDYKKNIILWAKNYKIPFRSNLKETNTQLISADQNNNLYFFNKTNGNILRTIPTEETLVKNQFINNLSMSDNSLFYLNTYGSLYSVDKMTMNINWFLNLNQTLDLNPGNLFLGTEVINNQGKIVIISNDTTYIIDSFSGSVLFKKKISSRFKPIIYDRYLFIISKKNFLVCLDLNTGKIIYSTNVDKKVSEFLKNDKKKIHIKNVMILNNRINLFLKNSEVIKFNLRGKLETIKKIETKINSNIIIIDGSILFLDSKNRFIVLN